MFSILWVYFIYSVYVFFKTTMKPPFRMPLFVPLNPSPGSLVYWSVKPQRSMIFPAIDLHDPFVDVFFHMFYIWLVVDLPLWKIYEFKSMGSMTSHIWLKIKFMFQSPPSSICLHIYRGFPRISQNHRPDPKKCRPLAVQRNPHAHAILRDKEYARSPGTSRHQWHPGADSPNFTNTNIGAP